MQRHVLGIFALLLSIGGFWMWISHTNVHTSVLAAACMRLGPTLGALWLAFPQVLQLLRRFPPMLIAAIVIGFGSIIIRPRTMAIVIPVVIVMWVLHFLGTLFKPMPRNGKPRT